MEGKYFWVSTTVLAVLTLNIHLPGAASNGTAGGPRDSVKSGSNDVAFCKEVLILHHSHVDVETRLTRQMAANAAVIDLLGTWKKFDVHAANAVERIWSEIHLYNEHT